ncbi:hypothetical protein ABZS83_23355 [Streptomyces sp. NPDC005426]|uniref:hypothetical protein n=1 Tax=Streptomyces sp. NPDC005426 TaxID=3155344 RepID=UPI0033A143F0
MRSPHPVTRAGGYGFCGRDQSRRTVGVRPRRSGPALASAAAADTSLTETFGGATTGLLAVLALRGATAPRDRRRAGGQG